MGSACCKSNDIAVTPSERKYSPPDRKQAADRSTQKSILKVQPGSGVARSLQRQYSEDARDASDASDIMDVGEPVDEAKRRGSTGGKDVRLVGVGSAPDTPSPPVVGVAGRHEVAALEIHSDSMGRHRANRRRRLVMRVPCQDNEAATAAVGPGHNQRGESDYLRASQPEFTATGPSVLMEAIRRRSRPGDGRVGATITTGASDGLECGVSPVLDTVDSSTLGLIDMMRMRTELPAKKEELNEQIDMLIQSIRSKYIRPTAVAKRRTIIDDLKTRSHSVFSTRGNAEIRRWLADELAGDDIDSNQLKYAQSGKFSDMLFDGVVRKKIQGNFIGSILPFGNGAGSRGGFSSVRRTASHQRASSLSLQVIPFNLLNQLALEQQKRRTEPVRSGAEDIVPGQIDALTLEEPPGANSDEFASSSMLHVSSPDLYLADAGIRLLSKRCIVDKQDEITQESALWYRERAVAYAFTTDDPVKVKRAGVQYEAKRKDWLVISDVDGITTCPYDHFIALWEPMPNKMHVFRKRRRVLVKLLSCSNSRSSRSNKNNNNNNCSGKSVESNNDNGDDNGDWEEETVVYVVQLWMKDGACWHYTLEKEYFHEKYELALRTDDAKGARQHLAHLNMFSGIFLPKEVRDAVTEKLQNAMSWDFDIFDLHMISDGNTLFYIGYYFFRELNLIHEFGIDEEKLCNFLHELEHSYKTNPYHNSIHGADVCQSSVHFALHGIQRQWRWKLTSVQKLALVVAALAHDVAHPGRTNSYLVKCEDELAIVYNDKSVLENLHAATVFMIMAREECNIFCNLDVAVYGELRRMIVELILSTDLASHFGILDKFKSTVLVKDFDPAHQPKHKEMLMIMALKCSDIGHPMKPHTIHLTWSKRCFTEFYCQGDEERRRGVKISPFCDRQQRDEPQSQVGFVKFLVRPLIRSFVDAVLFSPEEGDKSVWITNLNWNDSFWNDLVDKGIPSVSLDFERTTSAAHSIQSLDSTEHTADDHDDHINLPKHGRSTSYASSEVKESDELVAMNASS